MRVCTPGILRSFLFVDVQEWFTFGGAVLRTNICMSMTGSALYVVGSVVGQGVASPGYSTRHWVYYRSGGQQRRAGVCDEPGAGASRARAVP